MRIKIRIKHIKMKRENENKYTNEDKAGNKNKKYNEGSDKNKKNKMEIKQG